MSHALLQAWEKTVRRHGRKRAVVQAAEGGTATFRELDARADAWRRTHVADPKRVEGRAVVFTAPNGLGWLEIFLGLLKAGAVVVPLDAAEPPLAQRRLAASLRAGFVWDGGKLEPLAGARHYRDPEICLVKLTSGSTGQPRPLAFTAGQLLADSGQILRTMGITRRDINYALIPAGHAYGIGSLIGPLLAHGVPMVCGTAPLPHAIAADFARWRPTVFPGVPSMWRALAASDLALPSLRLAISAGAPLTAEVAREFAARFGRRLHNFYGSSETGGIAYDRSGTAAFSGHVGRAMRGLTLTVLGGARLQVSGAGVLTHGHRRRAEGFGAWIMPDRVAMDAQGNVTLLGRRGRTVKIAGRRVNLGEVSERLRKLPGVRDAWVGLGRGTEPVLGAVVAATGTAGEIRTALLADTAPWKIPRKLVVLPALPLTARGKNDTRALQAMLA